MNMSELTTMSQYANKDHMIQDLQQKLLASQASEARLRKLAEEYILEGESALPELDAFLSTQPNTAELAKYVESEIEKLFEVRDYDYHCQPLYARKDKQ
jgi:hypothetical protein